MPQSSIDVDDDPDFQKRSWIATRVGWAGMAAITAMALAGATGSGGALSMQTRTTATARLEMPRVARWTAQDDLEIEIRTRQGSVSRVTVPDEFGEAFAVEDIQPAPASVVASGQGNIYEFRNDGRDGPLRVRATIRAKHPGPHINLGSFEIDGLPARPAVVTVLP